LSSSEAKKIGLIGRVDPDRTLFDGQTVKTRMMHQLLCEMYGEDRVVVADTIDWRHRAPRILADTRRCLRECDDIVILLSRNGCKALYPVLARAARRRGKRIYQNLIGGHLGKDLGQFPKWRGYLSAFKVNWVESHALVDELASKGVTNAKYLPNFKFLDAADVPSTRTYDSNWSLCIFSRVIREKGVADAMEAVEGLSGDDSGTYSLDIYGPVEGTFQDEFDALLANCPRSRYLGSVSPEESISTIEGYDALLFPTYWYGEGIPGTIIDALAAGVPVIGAHWPYYGEMLEDGVTGFGYEFGRNELLPDAIRRFVGLTDDERNAMRHACLDRSKAYTPETVAGEIRREIGE
jgi:glycosyltransferase involved in cell wall biosynthesis